MEKLLCYNFGMAHQNFYIDLCVDTFIVNNGAVLLRLHEKYNYWGAPGGHIEPGEDVNQAALREVLEEVGLEVELVGPAGWKESSSDFNKDLVPPLFVNRHKITAMHDHSAFIFVAKANSREIAPQASKDVTAKAECLWLTRDELVELRTNDDRLGHDTFRYAMAALDLITE